MSCSTSSSKVPLFVYLLIVLWCTIYYLLLEEIFLVGLTWTGVGGKFSIERKTEEYYPNNEFWYIHPNGDRSGLIIQKMIFAHSYAYYSNLTFRGLCHSNLNRIRQVNSCLDGLHLTPLFNASSCPDNYNHTSSMKDNHPNIISSNKIKSDHYITPNWLADIKGQQRQQLLSQQQQQSTATTSSTTSTQNNNTTYRVAVHV
jgi:hypothetical protein